MRAVVRALQARLSNNRLGEGRLHSQSIAGISNQEPARADNSTNKLADNNTQPTKDRLLPDDYQCKGDRRVELPTAVRIRIDCEVASHLIFMVAETSTTIARPCARAIATTVGPTVRPTVSRYRLHTNLGWRIGQKLLMHSPRKQTASCP